MEVGSILTGIFAALPTPQLDDGRPDVAALSPLLDLLINAGVAGCCVGGVTGEYACFTVEERIRVLRHVSSRVAASKPLICGIGAENFFFNDTATTEIYTLTLHDALPISPSSAPTTV